MSRLIIGTGLFFDGTLGVVSVCHNCESLLPVTLLCLASSIASFVAAIEDNLDTQQRQQFRERQQQANDEQAASRSTSTNQNSRQKELRETEFRQSKEQSATADSGNQNEAQQNANNQSSEPREYEYVDSQSSDASEMYVTTMILVPVKECCDSVAMNQQTQHKCNSTCSKYKSELSKAWKNVHQCHADLVKLEAEKNSCD